MAPGHDEVVTAIVLEALPFTTTTMSAYELHPKVRRALCMHHCTNPPFAPGQAHGRVGDLTSGSDKNLGVTKALA